MRNKICYAILLVLIQIPSAYTQHLLSTDGQAIVNENQDTILLRGMGLGGWMLQEGYMLQTAEFATAQHQIKQHILDLVGIEKTEQFYEAWLKNHVTKIDMDSLKSWGFNSVRLPMHYNLYTLPIEDEPVIGEHTWLDKGFILTDSLISWCKQNEMYVILDLHGAPGGQGYDQAISDYDPSKPSLWESKDNRDKMVALWHRLAQRYVNEDWVAGYDLLNEVNWNMNGNIPLANLYKEITDSIRTVDTRHIIFIEGNWFANDFTGLTPPWDDNLVYSPHKYWSFNDQNSMQWVLDIRNNYNVPLYLGESGENSNVWFRDAIRLLEDLDIGWAWWPMKKVESIAGPLSITKTPEYESLLNYWNGNGTKPTEEEAFSTLMQLTENIKLGNCKFQPDVIDAMFRQVYSDTTIPYQTQSIPGIVYASDYDMGVLGEAYFDLDVATYHVSTSQFTAWNNGWSYRNDGVDIEPCMDNLNSNGFNVGWVQPGEWLQYSIDVESDAIYDVKIRIATDNSDSRLHLRAGEATLSDSYPIPNTSGWQDWQTMIIPDVILGTQDQKLRMYADEGSFNISSLEFVKKGNSMSLNTRFQSAETLDQNIVRLYVNKSLQLPLTSNNNFSISVNGENRVINSYISDPNNSRILLFDLSSAIRFGDIVRISYDGSQILATDGTTLQSFNNELVINRLPTVFSIPGIIQMEDYCEQEGVQLETTSDSGGGQNVGFLDPGDYLDFKVNIEREGDYVVRYRVASEQSSGSCRLVLIDAAGNEENINTASFPSTGGWQTWQSEERMITLPKGLYTLRVKITGSPFNFNWIQFESLEEEVPNPNPLGILIYPNPVQTHLTFSANFALEHNVAISIFNVSGQILVTKEYLLNDSITDELDIQHFAAGMYFLQATLEDGSQHLYKFTKI